MIHQIKAQLKSSYEQNARRSRIDNLVTDLASTLQMAYAIEEHTTLSLSDSFIEDVQLVIDQYSDQILSYEPEKKSE